MEEKKAKKQEIIETEIQMGTVHPAALEPYRVRFFVEDEIIKDAEITIVRMRKSQLVLTTEVLSVLWKVFQWKKPICLQKRSVESVPIHIHGTL